MADDRPEPEDAPAGPPSGPDSPGADDSLFEGETLLEHEGAGPEAGLDAAPGPGSLGATLANEGPAGGADGALPPTRKGRAGGTSAPRGARAGRGTAAAGDRYVDLGEMARGGMGAVLCVADRDLRRRVAMKVLLDPGDEDRSERFREEAQVTGQLEHPNIVPIHELGTGGDGRAYFTMKLVEGESLQHVVDRLAAGDEEYREAYPLSRLLSVLLKVCDAMAFAHSRGVVHRDLKPENVMVGRFGEVLVMDWGLAKVLGRDEETGGAAVHTLRSDAGAGRTLEGSVMGTPCCMPPEQADGRHQDVDERSDVFALGGLLYALLTHTPPYTGASVYQIIDKALKADVEPPRRRAPRNRIPPELASVCSKAMARDPRDRYPSAGALGDDLQAWLDRRLVSAHAYGPAARAVRFVQRHPSLSIAAAVAAFLLLAGGSALGVALSQKRAAELEAQAQADRRRKAEAETEAEEARRRAAESEAALERAHKRRAEKRAADAEASLEKSLRVAGFLRRAYVEVGGVPGAMKAIRRKPLTREEKRAEAGAYWDRVDRFGRTVPDDAAVQATWLALRGWISWNAGRLEESDGLFRQARETDPDVVYGWLFEALAAFSAYARTERFTNYYVTEEKGVVWSGRPTEHPEQARIREHFETLVRELGRGKVWGQTTAREFRDALEGFRAYYRGDLEAAVPGIGKALAVPDMIWIADELYFARAKARLLLFDLDGAVADLDRAHAFGTMGSRALHYKAQTLQVKGYMERHEGRDPLPAWREAIRIFDEEERLFPGMEVYHQMRGMIYQAMANILAGRGDDPEPFFRKALEDFTAGLDPPGTYAREFNIAVSYFSRCDTRTAMADHDERLGRDPGPNLKQALQDLLRGLLTYLELTFNVPKLERVLGRWCRHLSRQGRSPAAYCETWLDRLEKKASAHGAPPRAAMERALLLGCLGRYEETLALVASMEEPPVTWRRYARLLRRRLEALPAAPWKRSLLRARFWQGLGDFRAALDRCLAALGTVREPDPSDPDERADLAGLHVMTARMLARAAAGRTTLADEPAPVDPDTAEERKEKAVKHLARAAALGRNRPGAWLADPDLAPLRDLPSFRSLVGR